MFISYRREWQIRRTLKRASKQRVALVLQPSNVWVIENTLEHTEETDAALKTCYMRGWVEVLENSIPTGQLTKEGNLPQGQLSNSSSPIWKLTDSGWAAINRVHEWTLIGIFLAAISILVAVVL
jgi:hypothetical protein